MTNAYNKHNATVMNAHVSTVTCLMPGFHSHVPYVTFVPLPLPSFRCAVPFVPLPLMAYERTAKIGIDPTATERQLRQISATGQRNFFT